MAKAQAIPVAKPVAFNSYFALIHLTMALGPAITAVVTQGVIANPDLMKRILFNSSFAFGLFLVYSALTGVAISSIFIYYGQSTIFYTFWMAAGMFLFCSVVGLFIKRDLSGMGLFPSSTCSWCALHEDSLAFSPLIRAGVRITNN